MSLFLHLSIHVALSLLAGLIVWRIWKKPVASFVMAIVGGVLVDMDHFIDYFLAFGFNFDLSYFSKGYQFLQSGKIYVLFHGWEYVILLLIAAYFVGQRLILKIALFALAIGLFLHLGFDTYENDGMSIRAYSIIYRASKNFENKFIVTPEHYKIFLIERENAPFLNYSK
ncbi:MAG: hypothetical protein US63_C0004G0019 [Candidatus Moranbacteria bacterium GW2011_GWC2_37_8]|nr:MAG: hypothetical protein US63_C0004G0019 [Candidatus Moranbacteria bacterium GW2011_GWC2_37_8]KKQ62569.1 MAG: hypothetical protein US82_C0009G0019 [Parcubacteria group bacterium GW2011_GWC1_38_22]KKQ80730.1 MAG: hypothetical protein UT03_C0019G0003 [Candidatus Moranbacteria bacterium GW2011_GWD2_38_7]